MDRAFYVYMLASGRNGTLYVGVTSNLAKRIWEHREGLFGGFTKTYAVKTLVWHEPYPTALEAIAREKQLKKWRRAWKIALIETANPQWLDQYDHIPGSAGARVLAARAPG
jgi:putative endonuclease